MEKAGALQREGDFRRWRDDQDEVKEGRMILLTLFAALNVSHCLSIVQIHYEICITGFDTVSVGRLVLAL